jgi:4-amino-4-deoxy-L-arabinose transferase-like glycosyltransferase
MNPQEEPSVLDYVKARLMPWKYRMPGTQTPQPAPLGQLPEVPEPVAEPSQEAASPEWNANEPALVKKLVQPDLTGISQAQLEESGAITQGTLTQIKETSSNAGLPWRALAAVGSALIAQWMLEPHPNPNRWQPALLIYIAAFLFLAWSAWKQEWRIGEKSDREYTPGFMQVRLPAFLAGAALLILAYIFLGKPFTQDRFNTFNTLLWLAGILLVTLAFWERKPGSSSMAWLERGLTWARQSPWRIQISPWNLLWIAVFAIAVYFRFTQLAQVPPEMNSDHAEKLLDVVDVLSGQYNIFFSRNTGREPLQFYLIAMTAQIFGTGVSFLSMKIGTALAGVLTLPFIYLTGKEIANRRAGLLAMAFAGIAYWPNALSRVALRFSLYPLFVAPALYFLVRGLNRGRRNDFILSGLFLGIGLLGYTPIRILPVVIVAAVALYSLHAAHRQQRLQALYGLVILAFFAIAGSLPLLRYAQSHPEEFAYRAFSRLTELETSLPGPALTIFMDNLKNAMLMYGWNDGQIWPVSIPGRPALDVISGVFFYLGLVLLLIHYLRQRKWEYGFLILAVPMLMLPSILSLAFPQENPAPNRAGGAMVPVFLIIGLTMDGLMEQMKSRRWANVVIAGLFALAALQNYALVFNQYQQQYALSAWNTSEMGQVLRNFAENGGSLQATWVVKSPHWVDTRLVGIHAGEPTRDFGIDLENIPATITETGAKLFLVRHFARPEDRTEEEMALVTLQQTYPQGWGELYTSQYAGKDFWVFYAPPVTPGLQSPLYPELETP